jgi:hypothetical protein
MGLNLISSPFGAITAPSCTWGLIVIDGLLWCVVQYIGLLIGLFSISSSFAIIETVFIVPFLIALVMIVSDLLRGSG